MRLVVPVRALGKLNPILLRHPILFPSALPWAGSQCNSTALNLEIEINRLLHSWTIFEVIQKTAEYAQLSLTIITDCNAPALQSLVNPRSYCPSIPYTALWKTVRIARRTIMGEVLYVGIETTSVFITKASFRCSSLFLPWRLFHGTSDALHTVLRRLKFCVKGIFKVLCREY